MRRTLWAFLNDDGGATAIEYALIAAMFAIAAVSGYRAFGDSATSMYDKISEAITGAIDQPEGGSDPA